MDVRIEQTVAILVDGNNAEIGIRNLHKKSNLMLNFDSLVPRLLNGRGLNRLVYFREGKSISKKLAERLQKKFHGRVRPCYKSADVPLAIEATQLADKVDTIILISGDSDYIELVRYLKYRGVRVEIVGSKGTISGILAGEADVVHNIELSDVYEFK